MPGWKRMTRTQVLKASAFKVTALLFALSLFLFVFPPFSHAQDVSQYVTVTTANERSVLDRQTRMITSTADVTISNTSATGIDFPVHAVIEILDTEYANVQMPDALGGPDAPPYDKYYFELTPGGNNTDFTPLFDAFGQSACSGDCAGDTDGDGDTDGADLARIAGGDRLWPGGNVTFKVKFVRYQDIRFRYNVLTYGILETGNTPPVAHAGQDVTLSLQPGQTEAYITLDASASYDSDGSIASYQWSGSPDPNDVARPDLSLTAGQYEFSLVVTDDQGTESPPDTVTITVEAANPHAPEISVDPASVTVNEGETATIAVSASDPDGDPVTLSAAPRMENAAFTASAGTSAAGTFTFTPDHGQQGIYTVAFTARDPYGYTTTRTAQVTVTNVNRPPELSVQTPPAVDEGGLLTVTVQANDPDGDLLTLTAAGVPPNAVFIPATGTLTFAPAFDQAGTYAVTFEASDGQEASSQEVILTVTDVSDPGGDSSLTLEVDDPESPTLQTTARITGRVNSQGAPQVQKIQTSLITGLAPVSARQGQTLAVTLSGQTSGDFVTHFADGVSQVSFGEDVTVNSMTVNSETEIVADITIAADAATGPRGATVTTGDETTVSLLAFNILTGNSSLGGTVIDPDTGQPISGAVVVVQGTDLTTVTDSYGQFSFQSIPPGTHTVIINAQNHALISLEIDARIGQELNAGTIEAKSTVFNPNSPPSASLHSLLARFSQQSRGQLTLEEAKALVIDTIMFAGGDEIGVLDEYGNQLNPKVADDGLLSLSDFYVEGYAERLVLDKSMRLMDILYGISFAFKWTKGEPPTLNEWISALQKVVNKAWLYPDDPDSRLPILLFNTSNVLTADPPVISPSMHLNDLKGFLLFTSLLTGYEMFVVEGVGPPLGIGNNPQAKTGPSDEPVLMASAKEVVFPSPAAHDSPGDPSNFTYYLLEKVDNNLSDFMDVYLSGGMLAMQVPQLWDAYDRESKLKGTLKKQFGKLVGEKYLESICAPPVPEEAVVFDPGTPFQSVGVRFRRSNTDPGAPFDGSADAGTLGQRRYGYHLYRQQYLRGGVTLVPVADSPWYTDDPDSLLLIDPDPLPGVNHYRVVFLHGDIDIDFRNLFVQQDLSSARLLRWAGHVIGTGTEIDDLPLASFSSLLHRSTSYISRLSQNSIGISVPDPAVSENNPVVDLVVNKDTGKIYLGDRQYDEIVEIDPLGGNDRTLIARTGFALPGQAGLAITPAGDLYTDNAASDSQFGGRIFRFKPAGGKEYAGQVNYFSSLLSMAHPVSVVSLASDANGDLYVADNYDRQVKRLPMAQAISENWPANRIVAKGIGAEIAEGFSSFSDMTFDGRGNLFISSGPTIYRWLAAGETISSYSEIPQARFAGLATDSRNQLYITCQGVGATGEKIGFLMVVPEDTIFSSDESASKYKFLRNLTYPGELEVSADGKAIIYTEGGRAKAQYFGISGQLVDDDGDPLITNGNPVFVKAYSDIGESQWVQADENGIFSIMGLLGPGQKFHGNSSKRITLAIKSGGYTEEREVTLHAEGQTLLNVTHNSYEVIIEPKTIMAAAGHLYDVTYFIIERGTHRDVTTEVFNQGMIELSVGSSSLVQIAISDAGQFTVRALAEPDSLGTYAAVSLKNPSTGKILSYGTVSVYGQQYALDIKTSPCSVITDPSGATVHQCSDVANEIIMARGSTKNFTAEVYDGLGNRITDLDALLTTGYEIEFITNSAIPGAPELTITNLSPGDVVVEIPSDAKEGYSYTLQWRLKKTSDNWEIASSHAVTIRVRDFSISKEVILNNDPPALGEEVSYLIKITNYNKNTISGEFVDIVPDVLDITGTTPNVSHSGNTIENTLTIPGNNEEVISIGCEVNSTDYDSVVNTASFTYMGTTKRDTAVFGAKTSLTVSGPVTMNVRGVTDGWHLSECTPDRSDKFKFLNPLPFSDCYAPPPPTGEPFMHCLNNDDCSKDDSCDESDPIKTVQLNESFVTLFGTTHIPIEVEIAEGTNNDTITFSSDLNSQHIAFSPAVVEIDKQGSIGRASTILEVSDLWKDTQVDRDNPPEKFIVYASTQSHGEAAIEIKIVDNFQILKNIYLKDPQLYRRGGYDYSEYLEWLSTGVLGQATINASGALIKDNTMVCTNYVAHILQKFNLYRSLPGSIWWFNGLEYGPLQTSFDWENICQQNDGTHHAVSLYPAGYFLTEEDRVLDGWWNQQPMVWHFPDWESYFSWTIWFKTPGARERGLNYPNSKWFDPRRGYPSENQVIGSKAMKSRYMFSEEEYENIESLIPEYTSIIIGSPVSFVVTDSLGRRSGKDDLGNVYDEIPGLGFRVTQFKKDTGDPVFILNHISRDFDLTLYPTNQGTASLAALRILPDGSARREIYQNFPITPGHSVHYSPHPDIPDTPPVILGDGSEKAADFSSSVFVVSHLDPAGNSYVKANYPAIRVQFSKPVPSESLDMDSFRLVDVVAGENVFCSYEYDQDTRTVTLTPHEQLLPDKEYAVSVILKQVPLIDNQLDDFEYEWHFYTKR